jgi:hypothetical protein
MEIAAEKRERVIVVTCEGELTLRTRMSIIRLLLTQQDGPRPDPVILDLRRISRAEPDSSKDLSFLGCSVPLSVMLPKRQLFRRDHPPANVCICTARAVRKWIRPAGRR